jgi:Fe-S-cluster containining protein
MTAAECDGCGACCRTFPIFATREDAAREPRLAAESRPVRPPEAQAPAGAWAFQLYPLPFHSACCFLDAENRCGIYATRPQVCRDFPAGGDLCQQARAAEGLPPLPGSMVPAG